MLKRLAIILLLATMAAPATHPMAPWSAVPRIAMTEDSSGRTGPLGPAWCPVVLSRFVLRIGPYAGDMSVSSSSASGTVGGDRGGVPFALLP